MKFTNEEERSKFIFLYDQALTQYKNERHGEALKLCEHMNEIWPDAGAISELMGHIYFLGMADLDRAVTCYKKAIQAGPRAEVPSLGLFHVLWNMNRKHEAFDEMRRFISLSSSQAYTELVYDMAKEFNVAHSNDTSILEIIKRIQQTLDS